VVSETSTPEAANNKSPSIKQRSVINSIFFARLGQRLIHLLSVRTGAGTLYEIDMRLRPDGASGMLVSKISSYEKYQHEKAWVWEHQALVRARAITGDPVIIQQFNEIRKDVLMKSRDIADLKTEVIKMRKKMRQSLSRGNKDIFDIKQDEGGLVDIEFIVQFAVLAWAKDFPELCEYTDNIELLSTLQKIGRLSEADAIILIEGYKAYRQQLHALALQDEKGLIERGNYVVERENISSIWNKFFAE